MKTLTRWFLDNPVAANLLMIFIFAAGLLSINTLRVESFPQIPPSRLIISVAYPGGSASQVDEGVTQRIEDAVSGVAGIKTINSESYQGMSTVKITKNTGVSLDRLMDDVRNQVESIVGFPEQVEKPRIYRDEFGNLASFVMVYGGENADLLQETASRVSIALKKHPAISRVSNQGRRNRQLRIEPDSVQLQRYGLSIDDLANRIRHWSLEYRSGELKTARGLILLRGSQQADNLMALKNLPVIYTQNGQVRLSDIAVVERGFEATDSIVRFQGEQAIALMVTTSAKDNLLAVSDAVAAVLKTIQPSLPEHIRVDVMADMAPYISEQLDLLSTNAWQGLLIVLLLLGLFLEVRLAFWVALGVPVSIAGALWLMGTAPLNYSINDITLFGMILVLGILVDDAVVVGESIHQARQTVADPKEAAWKGVESVAVATTYGVLTTIAAFSPMLWIENELAKVLAGFSAVVIIALLFSLIESKFILPTHLCLPASNRLHSHVAGRVVMFLQNTCTGWLNRFTYGVYQPLLNAALKARLTTLLLFATFMLAGYGLLIKGNVMSVFFPEIPGRYATLKVTMDQDVTTSLTLRNTEHLEQALEKTSAVLQQQYQLSAPPVEKYVVAMLDNLEIELTAELSVQALTDIPSEVFLQQWRQQTGVIEGSYAADFTLSEEIAGGTALAVSAPSRDLAKTVTEQLKQALMQLPGVSDVYDESQLGRRQLNIVLNERGILLGVDQRQLATLIGGAFGHIEVYRLLEKGGETQSVLKFPERDKKTVDQLKATPVHLGGGQYVSLGEISDFKYTREPDILYRHNRDEVINIYWQQNRSVRSPEENWKSLQASVIPELKESYPGVNIQATGEFEEIMEVQQGFRKAMFLTLLLIYILLAIPLKSYWQPLIIMSVIPFGFAGAIYGHGLMGIPFSLLSMFGLMAMTGVVINDSLVLITRFNALIRNRVPMMEALIEAGTSRVRAIFLTTVTTVCGLLPLLSETSEQAQYLKPAAVSLVFGELFATPITLLLIPVILGGGRYFSTHKKLQD